VRAPRAEWWARVRDARGRVGWIAPDARVVVPGLNCAV
jgi:hypothetical protein